MGTWIQRNTAPVVAAVAVMGALLWMASPLGSGSPMQTRRHLERVFSHALPGPETLLSEVTFAVFDLETTGLSPARDRVVELGLVRVRNGYLLGTRSWLVHPGRPIPEAAQRVHHISDEDVQDQPPLAAIYPAFARQLAGSVMVAHNAGFDVRFLQAEAARAGFPEPPNHVIDTLRLARNRYTELSSHTLEDVARRLQINVTDRHRAQGDTLVLAEILVRVIDDLGPAATLGDLYKEAGGWMVFEPPM